MTEPHAAYCGLTHGLKSMWNYAMRTTPGTGKFLSPIENIIRHKFLPALTGRSAISDSERELLALPCQLGGLGIPDLTKSSSWHYQASLDNCRPLVNVILNQQHTIENDITAEQRRIKMKIKSDKRKQEADTVENLNLPEHLVKAAKLAQDKGSSNWLTTLHMGFHLTRVNFTTL